MSILLSGDFHANAVSELHTITRSSLLTRYGKEDYDSIKYHIILGDGGFLWPGNREKDSENFRELAKRSFPVLCIIGNHEPMLGFDELNEVDIGIGEKVFLINREPFVAYLKRGKIYNIDGFRILALGGALSIDKNMRVPGVSWWKNEYWQEYEKRKLFGLIKNENNFDYVFSHTGPDHINRKLAEKEFVYYSKKFDDEVAVMNDEIDKSIVCRQWFCGHWHKDEYIQDKKLKRGYQYLYRTTKIIAISNAKKHIII